MLLNFWIKVFLRNIIWDQSELYATGALSMLISHAELINANTGTLIMVTTTSSNSKSIEEARLSSPDSLWPFMRAFLTPHTFLRSWLIHTFDKLNVSTIEKQNVTFEKKSFGRVIQFNFNLLRVAKLINTFCSRADSWCLSLGTIVLWTSKKAWWVVRNKKDYISCSLVVQFLS